MKLNKTRKMNKSKYDIDSAVEYIKRLEGCCLRGMPINYQVLEVTHWQESQGDGPNGWMVCRISYNAGNDERWAVIQDSQDYSGHG